MLMHRLVVADVADPDQPRMPLCTQEPRSATRGYSFVRFLIPGFLIRISSSFHHFFKGERRTSNIRKGFSQPDNDRTKIQLWLFSKPLRYLRFLLLIGNQETLEKDSRS